MKSPKCLRTIKTICKYRSSINHDQQRLIMVIQLLHNQDLINKGLTLHQLQIAALLTSVNELLKTLSIQTITFPSKNVLDYVGLRLTSNFGRRYASVHDKTFKTMKDIDTNDGTNNTLPSDLWVDDLASCHFYFDPYFTTSNAADPAIPTCSDTTRIVARSSVMLSCCKASRNSSKSKLPDLKATAL